MKQDVPHQQQINNIEQNQANINFNTAIENSMNNNQYDVISPYNLV